MERATRATDDLRLRDMVARLQETRVRTVSSAMTLTEGDDVVLANTTGGDVTVTLPVARTHAGKEFSIKKMSAANTLTVAPSGADTIDDGASVSWTTQYQSLTFVSTLTTAPSTFSWVIV